ncbi:2-oxoglutarate dehydrogenase complex dihydrolipoyllysine-residue succinyltransferase [Phaeovibrio sulfidiphilus]|uniref:Dihydrolipoyllysine-residue succinyltransferase component of 2-oxoglutarate dehydrogenase complex n=1 Tax=Phaeovibrio sulfidiphilus TaxID=1220600 RepID=A0A8J7CQ13_9PROT|nr:2-oxoglutarate dehydrogenase complex dihydrolipoyllysine-residue succinyltransferase [Phaeovibrio sulfidiphilus]MBE1237727.1 2-oxoglutarate dehydrogenase complex dihydrolipoyllysine-residue succinyltransferase [Phaeovibrio sulfidiphilus]
MAIELTVPQLGESVSEATVAKWLKAAGEAVVADEPLVELETDKVTVEVPCPVSGVLSEIVAAEGAEVEVGAVLALIEEGATATAAPAAAKSGKAASGAAAAAGKAGAAKAPAPAAASGDSFPVPPGARKLIEENRLDPAKIPATGKDGRLTREDVVNSMDAAARAPAAASAPSATAARPAGDREERVKMTRLRRAIAQRLKGAQDTAAILTTFNEVDMTAILETRKRYKDVFEKKHGVKLGFMSFFVKACVSALKDIPAINAEIDGDEIVYKNHYDIGIAVGGPTGLVVPVVRDCDQLSFAGIEAKIIEYGNRARDGKLTLEEMSGGTFTVSNGGVYGSLLSTPILNPPQSGILGMHKTQMRPVVLPDGSIAARPMMYLALSYDHRIVDGKEAVTFLVHVKDCLEDPVRLLLEEGI